MRTWKATTPRPLTGISCLVAFAFVLITARSNSQSVVINEVMASNSKTIYDVDGDYEDWIELYNTTGSPVDLNGYKLKNDPSGFPQWTFPQVTIPAHGHLLVWASNKNRKTVQGASKVSGGGRSIWSNTDSFHFEYQQFQGDFDASLRVRWLADTSQWAKAGLMLREALTNNSRNVYVRVTAQHGFGMQWRTTAGGLTQTTGEGPGVGFPNAWVRLVRSGNQLTGYYSENGTGWVQLPQVTLSGLPATVYVGVAVCSHDEGDLTHAVVSEYRLTPPSASISSNWTGANINTTDVGSSQPAIVLHTNFRLDRNGDYVALHNAADVLLDSISFTTQTTDISYGRKPDGAATWQYFEQPTPGAANSTPAQPNGRVAQPTFTPRPGPQPGPVWVSILCQTPGAQIRYTTDGTEPTAASTLYGGSFQATTSTIVRARAFASGYFDSPIATASFLVNQPSDLNIISLVTAPNNLWGPTGIYDNATQKGIAWERPVSVEFFPKDGSGGFKVDCGIRIHGGASRTRSPKKSFRLYFRSNYGPRRLEYPLFPDTPVDRFDKIVLRAGFNDSWGYDNTSQRYDTNYIRDQVFREVDSDMGRLAPHGIFAEVYLNGLYWGLYNPCERVEANFAGSYSGNSDWDIIKLEEILKDGDMAAWNDFKNYYQTTDFSIDANYRALWDRLDVDNFTGYILINAWMQNYDWPRHNGYYGAMRNVIDGRWQFFSWDCEYSFGCGSGGFNVNNRNMISFIAGQTGRPIGQIFNALLANSDYRLYFLRRYDDFLNTALSRENVSAHLEARVAEIDPAIPREAWRWGYPRPRAPLQMDYSYWLNAVDQARLFVNVREDIARGHVQSFFNEVTGWTTVTIEAPQGGDGDVWVNRIRPDAYPWTGRFFTGITHTLRAEPAPGYVFVGWSDSNLPATDTVEVDFAQPGGGGGSDVLLAAGSTWKYNDTGTDLGTAWRSAAYDDSTWPGGGAQLGYGDGDETTVISYGPDSGNKYPCYYFRRSFTVADASKYSSLLVELVRDDGAVVYLNGTEILRDNMPAGTITYGTHASSTAQSADENNWRPFTVPVSSLVTGSNLLAVEVHQVNFTSSDVSFDLRLTGQVGGAPPPDHYAVHAIFGVDPTPPDIASAQFVARDRIVVRFDRSVNPVTASVASNYSVDHGIGQPFTALPTADPQEFLLVFGAPLASDTDYLLGAINVSDLNGHAIAPGSPATITVSYHIPPVVINEVMYNSNGTDVEWIELHNTTAAPMDISGWYLTDDDSYPATGEGNWTIPSATVLAPDSYVVVALDADEAGWAFAADVQVIYPVIGDGGNLGNGGDNIALFDGVSGGSLIDGSLTDPYPDLATAGHSIEKIDDYFPWRSHPLAWREAVVDLGWISPLGNQASPGRANGTFYNASEVRNWQMY